MLFLFFGYLAIWFAGLGCAAVQPIVRPPHQPTSNGTKPLTFNQTIVGELRPEGKGFNWVTNSSQDGLHVTVATAGLILEDVVTEKQTILVPDAKLPKGIREFWFNSKLTKILYATNDLKQYRHSYFADYFVQDVKSGDIVPLVADQKQDIQYAVWSGNVKENTIAYVRGNNIYIWKDGKTTQVTRNGGPDMFNGVPDWVYEEEILENNFALWFNEAGDRLAYLSINETGVQTFTVLYYMNQSNPKASIATPYPRKLDIRYPKVGTTNPTAKLSLLNVNWGQAGPQPLVIDVNTKTSFEPDNCIIGEVKWLGDRLAARVLNRVQNVSKLFLYDTRDNSTKVIRSEDGGVGWIDNTKTMQYLGVIAQSNQSDVSGKNGCCEEYFLDRTDLSNWNHYYLYPTKFDKNDPIPVTSGNFDIRKVLHVDKENQLIYYSSTETHPTESHLYMVSYRTWERTNITDTSKPGYYSAYFTPGSKYVVINYEGPNIPYQELYAVGDLKNPVKNPIRIITSNQKLKNQLKEYKLPKIRYADLKHPSGWNLSAMLRYPTNFNPEKKYPVILVPYGGPSFQEVTKRMASFDFKTWLAADPDLQYFTYTVDNRGTAFRGRAFQQQIAHHMGEFEAEDQVWAASQLALHNKFIDKNKIAIWGWSHGAYISAKAVELDSGVISLAVISAPVTDFRLYDSMWTERYMGLLSTNSANYTKTAVRNVAGFKNIAGGVLMQHGLGDDNVHFQNSAALVDLLMGAGIGPDKLQASYFTDSDHDIRYNRQKRYVYKQIAERLWQEKIRVVGNNTSPPHGWLRVVTEDSGSGVFSEGFEVVRDGGEGKSWNTTDDGTLMKGTREYEERFDAFVRKLS
ncbi:dipeptidyl peptidase IV N-terminal region-domain-containing protein [Venturia nashicola]|uniref:dipeptidyl-peptidase IV n=1 Tax=Venturia nashicola TaxID=86259 RepID=A0A4Z1NP54_9PEZI|nr:dipeptidyl peptidase IV N-terminal region-domain-containing protein [Venturia nashicola]